MRHPHTRIAALAAAVLIALAACSATSSRATDDSSATTTSSSSTSTSSTVAGETTTTAAGATTAPATTPATPARTTPATPAPTSPATPAPTSPPPSGPQVTATFSGPSACPSPDASVPLPSPTVSITWSVTGADSVYVAIDNPDGPYETGLPLNGSMSDLPFGCPGTHTYYVVAVKGGQKAVKSKTFTANN